MKTRIIRKIKNKQSLSEEENTWLNKMLLGPKVLRRIVRDVLGKKNISDK